MNWRSVAEGVAATAVVVGAVVTGFVDSWSPETWSAVATWITAAVAVAAAYVGLHQLGEARRLRLAQAQPYVVAYIEPSAASSVLVDLVVRNFGTTAAHDVRLTIAPTPQRAIDEDTPPEQRHVWLPESIPVLVPGQAWRTLWDTGLRRYEDGRSRLPEHHDATVSYADSSGERYQTAAVLDWRMLAHRDTVTVYGAHDAAKALRDISKAVGAWKETGGGLSVHVRDGDAKDERARERREARLAERRELESDDRAQSAQEEGS